MKALIGFATRCACVVALVPMLLWPCFVRANCCCSERELLSEQLTCDAAAAQSSESYEATNQARFQPACPTCNAAAELEQARVSRASDGSNVRPTDWLAQCDCQYQQPTTARSELEQLARPSKKSWCATLGESPGKQIFAHSATGPSAAVSAGFYPTPTQRRALLCCWLI